MRRKSNLAFAHDRNNLPAQKATEVDYVRSEIRQRSAAARCALFPADRAFRVNAGIVAIGKIERQNASQPSFLRQLPCPQDRGQEAVVEHYTAGQPG